jgi:hypothetical protein
MNDRKRPPSYSDSYFILNGSPLEPLEPLEPLVKPPVCVEPFYFTLVRFTLKGSMHLLFISSFESIFYFLYVSVSEDSGILDTVNTYYVPLLKRCSSWSNSTRTLAKDILAMELNKTTIDSQGIKAAERRYTYNGGLKQTSILYSLVFLGLTLTMVVIINVKKIKIHWTRLIIEHISFVILLALYEYFFYQTIIYKYSTISTPELNQYIVDGLYKCL